MSSSLSWGIWLIRNLFGFDMAPVLASVGVVGLAVGFGAQNLVRDVVSGFFIIMEGQYGVGDAVEINGLFGYVEEVGLRITKLRDPNGELRYFPNGTITQANRYTEGCISYRLVVPFTGRPLTTPPPSCGRCWRTSSTNCAYSSRSRKSARRKRFPATPASCR